MRSAPPGWIPDLGDRVRHRFARDFHGRIVAVDRRPAFPRLWLARVELDRLTFGEAAIETLVPAEWYHRAWLREVLGFRWLRRIAWARRVESARADRLASP